MMGDGSKENGRIGVLSDAASNTNNSSKLYENDEEFMERRYSELQSNSLYGTVSTEKEEPIPSNIMTPSNWNIRNKKRAK